MKLTVKLPLAFAAAMLLIAGTALYGIHTLKRALQTYETTVRSAYDQRNAADALALQFKTQVQEWKNTLLRGRDPAAKDKHWNAFVAAESRVGAGAVSLRDRLPDGEPRRQLEKFIATHDRMGASYRKGLEAFTAAHHDPAAGDAAVTGIDREPSKLLEALESRIAADAQAVSDETAVAAQHAVALSLGLMALVCVAGVAGSVVFSRTITRPIGRAMQAARAIAGGDLAFPIDAAGQDETAALLRSMQSMQANLHHMVHTVRQNSDSVATASAQIAQGNLDLSQRTERQASALQQTASSMERLNSNVRLNADHARMADDLARTASDIAVKGGSVVAEVVGTMKGINESSRKIADIISVIDAIAFQTNILALNAAVESARAGEQGRGFAVVASEVRSLAARSADAAREIKSLIHASVERVDQGTSLVDHAGATMTEIVGAIQRVTGIMAEISAASAEQSAGMAEVGQAVSQMDQSTQHNAALVEESAAAASSLRHQADELAHLVARFRLDRHAALAPA